ncbi:sensor histidine kinase [Chitinophaga cymbidii]|uniref:sensor histidine kinase n=1 Tax=Chitinophaga cymbidii TaxID=1096750 RepID=UPI0011BD6C84|nr:HAMP domain-containing sensor histidine kinase [Chitinophaga cymbidii]
MKPNQHIRISHLLNGIKEPALVISTDEQTVLKANKPALAILGNGKASNITGKPLQSSYRGSSLQKDDMPVPLPASFLLPVYPEGRRQLIDFRVSKIKIHRKAYWLAIGRTVEKQQTLKLQLQHLEKEKMLHEMKVSFMSMASHEFRTPLTAIASSIDLLETRLQLDNQFSEFYRHNIHKISDEIFSLNTMLDEILTLSKIVSNNFSPRQTAVDVHKVISSLECQYFSNRKDGRSLVIKVAGKPRNVFVDKDHLAKIFNNLIGNAFKYSEKKNPAILLSYHKHKLVVKVRDHGIGIPQKDLPHLFTSFYRGSNVDSIEGTGLGLAIVKTFVESNNGTISVESEERKGTTFTLAFRYTEED